MNDLITLTGYLGKAPDLRETQERTRTQKITPSPLIFEHSGSQCPDEPLDVAEEHVAYDVTIPSRKYGVLSLATHSWQGSRRSTTWHRVVVWNVDRMEFLGVRIARKGSRVKITGRATSFPTRDGRLLEQIELTEFRILQLK